MILNLSSLGVPALVALIGLLFFILSRSLRNRTGLPEGRVIYSDSGAGFQVPKPLYSKKHKLVGKPDYILEDVPGYLVPVEYKSTKGPKKPYESHVLQLAAYCLLVEEHYHSRPEYGVIRYQDRSFRVAYTDELEAELIEILADMRSDLRARNVPRSHNEWHRCQGCGFEPECEESLMH